MRRRAVVLLFFIVMVLPAAEQNIPVSPERAPALMKLPEGFRVTLFAGEPDILKPMAMTTDDRGRLWVVESHSYPKWQPEGQEGKDKIIVFEDKDHDGKFDTRTVFWDKGTNLSGIAFGFGGVWLCATPNLLFVPMKPGEDKPAGKPEVVLDGWDIKARHNVFNSLVWGPDGWLYGCNGILSNSRVGKPGTPDKERVPINCGVWRYHPTRKVFEAFAHGTTNPWGLDFDDEGEMFITNCVIKHLFHVVPGAHFQRMFGQDMMPNSYGLMESCADHFHWAGGHWTSSRGGLGAHNDTGGGHAHAGAMIYLGDNWPDSYRNRLFTCNIHGNRINQDILEHHGSGYIAKHGPDFLMANDPWFRGLSILQGADGGVFVSDWHDTGECHNYEVTHPSGRIYKITYGKTPDVEPDFTRLSDEQLVRLQLHRNDWWVRQARRVLQERASSGRLSGKVRPLLLNILADPADASRRLRALWGLYAIGGLSETEMLDLLDNKNQVLRRWAIRLAVDQGKISVTMRAKLAEMAKGEPATPVRLALASALQRIPPEERWLITENLAGHLEDAGDANLPLMIWYGLEPLVRREPTRALGLLNKIQISLLRQYVARGLASPNENNAGLDSLMRLLAQTNNPDLQRDIIEGVAEALQGQRLQAPKEWGEILARVGRTGEGAFLGKVQRLAVRFGDSQAIKTLKATVVDSSAKDDVRRGALQSLLEAQAPDLLPMLRELVVDKTMRGPALRALASFNEADIPGLILRHYGSFTDQEKLDAVTTLASRPNYAQSLLEAVEKNQVPRRDLSAFTVRQILALKDNNLSEKLKKVWGTIKPAGQGKAEQLYRYMAVAAPEALKKGDRSHGRLIFSKTCATCHRLFDDGAKIGPDLTGSQRINPEYLLSKILDPNAVVAKDYQMTILTTTAGRVLNGIIAEENGQTVAVQTQTELLRLPKGDIEERRPSNLSLMPEGLLEKLSDMEIRDLIAYLAGQDQVALPKEEK